MQSIGESWNQAAETTGVNQIDSGIGVGLGLLLFSIEILWWLGIISIAKFHFSTGRDSEDREE
ncbi:MAG: hypothetical protein QGF94_01310 [Candidatus Thalassarchaeaceae archaeon]|jgi:hypothetical protein|nr:hypothetical protein [Candidatus Thalassarchaeaceae archaeon]